MQIVKAEEENPLELTFDELEMLRRYRSLDERGREYLDRSINTAYIVMRVEKSTEPGKDTAITDEERRETEQAGKRINRLLEVTNIERRIVGRYSLTLAECNQVIKSGKRSMFLAFMHMFDVGFAKGQRAALNGVNIYRKGKKPQTRRTRNGEKRKISGGTDK